MSTSNPPATTTSTTLKLSSENPLRRRMRLLNRAHSLSSANGSRNLKILPLPEMTHSKSKLKQQEQQEAGEGEGVDELSPLEYETGSESSEEEKGGLDSSPERRSQGSASARIPPVRPRVKTSLHPPSSSSHWKKDARSPMSPNTRAWYEFDLAVVVALVSPIGNWLTGGDHIKNLLLVVLLIFYLHQIIEIPWSLYQKARPRRRSLQFPPSPSEPADVRYTHLAASELRRLELFFLLCTLLSPLFGALLLRYATAAVLGPDAVSWFSTGLFVLATGMRPWAHLVDRLNERTMELHDFIHYPEMFPISSAAAPKADQQELLAHQESLEHRIAKLEKLFLKLKTGVTHSTEEVYDYVDDLVENLESTLRQQESRADKFEGQVSLVERSLADMQRNPIRRGINSAVFGLGSLKNAIYSVLRRIPVISWFVGPRPTTRTTTVKVTSSSPRTDDSNLYSPSPRSVRRARSLDTIYEEEVVVYERYPLLVRPIIFASVVVRRCLSFALYPLLAVVRMVLRAH